MTPEEKLKVLCQVMGLVLESPIRSYGPDPIPPTVRLHGPERMNLTDKYSQEIDCYRYYFFYDTPKDALKALEQWTPNKQPN